jgi:hypothetical protein
MKEFLRTVDKDYGLDASLFNTGTPPGAMHHTTPRAIDV